jgi:hypothetical protein
VPVYPEVWSITDFRMAGEIPAKKIEPGWFRWPESEASKRSRSPEGILPQGGKVVNSKHTKLGILVCFDNGVQFPGILGRGGVAS